MVNRWSSLFFPATVMNETNYFIVLEYSTKGPGENTNITFNEAKAKHLKFTGFVESRIKNFLQSLQVQLGALGSDDYVFNHDNLLIVPESPFKSSDLSSIFVIALPCLGLTETMQEVISYTIVCFDLRLGNYIEIGGWVNHSSAYQIL